MHFCEELARELAHLKSTVTIATGVNAIPVLLPGNGTQLADPGLTPDESEYLRTGLG